MRVTSTAAMLIAIAEAERLGKVIVASHEIKQFEGITIGFDPVARTSWEDTHPNDNWRGKGNRKKKFR